MGRCIFVLLLGAALSCKTSTRVSSVKDDEQMEQPAASENGAGKFDIIDTSFLLPFPEQNDFAIKTSDLSINKDPAEPRLPLLALEQFKRLPPDFLAHQGGLSPEELYDRLYITGFRYDPCFPIVSMALPQGGETPLDPFFAGCKLRAIRLVGQFIDFKSGTASPASMHILFVTKHPTPEVDKAINGSIIDALKKIKSVAGVSTNGVPLGIHPGFSGPNKDVFKKVVKGLILSVASQKNFFATSVFFKVPLEPKGEATWKWAQLMNNPIMSPDWKNKKLEIAPSTGFASIPQTDEDKFFGKVKLAANGNAITIPGKDQLRQIQDPALGPPLPDLSPILTLQPQPSAEELAKGVNAADFYENPKVITIPGADCAGCHTATQRKLNALSDGMHRPFQFKPANGITGAMDPAIEQTMSAKATGDSSSVIVINFGYHGHDPVVSQRTVNEAGQVIRLINEKMWDWTAPQQ